MRKKSPLNPTVMYSFVQSSYWVSFCVIYNFSTIFLLSKGFANKQIGLVMGLASLFSALIQPLVASIADHQKQSVSKITLLIIFVTLSLLLVFLFVPDFLFLIAFTYASIVTLLITIQPLINAMGMELNHANVPINFGIARGFGSLFYAITSYFLGWYIERQGIMMLPTAFVLSYLALLLAIVMFRLKIESSNLNSTNPLEEITSSNAIVSSSSSGIWSILKEDKRFSLLLVGMMGLFMCHSLINNYMIHIMRHVGGGTMEMGTAIGIAALLELPVMASFLLLLKKFRCDTVLKFSAFFFSIKALMTMLASQVVGIYLAQAMQMFSFALFLPASVYYVNAIMKQHQRVKGQALLTMSTTLGGIAGSMVGGWLLDVQGITVTLVVGVGCSILGTILILIYARPIREIDLVADPVAQSV